MSKSLDSAPLACWGVYPMAQGAARAVAARARESFILIFVKILKLLFTFTYVPI